MTKLLSAGGLLALAFALATERGQLLAGCLVAAGLAGWAVRDVIAPVRLAADADGVTVIAGFAGRRRLAWSQIDQVRVDRRERFGLRTELLEIDAGETLYLLSAHDLGTDPQEVADALAAVRTGSWRPAGPPGPAGPA